ncbi:hypothetical protein [Pyxidicoccus fallax]|uniref:hypothetical protein n=1 Tax=Pyxidicoccus fallax TaxID=394095 RepID=UPI001FEA7E7F|nr:hypothetical protein [Pyxidicoccus fallax]
MAGGDEDPVLFPLGVLTTIVAELLSVAAAVLGIRIIREVQRQLDSRRAGATHAT